MNKGQKAIKDNERIAALLNRIMEYELAGVVRYTHYSLMVFGHNRLPIISWLSGQADKSLAHAHQAGEMITHIGAHPSLEIGPLLETHKHDIDDILRGVAGARSGSVAALPRPVQGSGRRVRDAGGICA